MARLPWNKIAKADPVINPHSRRPVSLPIPSSIPSRSVATTWLIWLHSYTQFRIVFCTKSEITTARESIVLFTSFCAASRNALSIPDVIALDLLSVCQVIDVDLLEIPTAVHISAKYITKSEAKLSERSVAKTRGDGISTPSVKRIMCKCTYS